MSARPLDLNLAIIATDIEWEYSLKFVDLFSTHHNFIDMTEFVVLLASLISDIVSLISDLTLWHRHTYPQNNDDA
jgi:hypothetical protein